MTRVRPPTHSSAAGSHLATNQTTRGWSAHPPAVEDLGSRRMHHSMSLCISAQATAKGEREHAHHDGEHLDRPLGPSAAWPNEEKQGREGEAGPNLRSGNCREVRSPTRELRPGQSVASPLPDDQHDDARDERGDEAGGHLSAPGTRLRSTLRPPEASGALRRSSCRRNHCSCQSGRSGRGRELRPWPAPSTMSPEPEATTVAHPRTSRELIPDGCAPPLKRWPRYVRPTLSDPDRPRACWWPGAPARRPRRPPMPRAARPAGAMDGPARTPSHRSGSQWLSTRVASPARRTQVERHRRV